MAVTQMYVPGRRPGMKQDKGPGRFGAVIKGALILLILVAAGWGIWALCTMGGSDAATRNLTPLARSQAARAAWTKANAELNQAKSAGQPVTALEEALKAATDEWAAAEAVLQDRIAAARLAWNQAQARRKQGDTTPELAAQIAGLEAELAALGATPELPPPPQRYRVSSNNPNYAKPFNYAHVKNGDLKFPAQRDRTACSSVEATAGIVVDLNTRNVLWAKNPDRSVPIASMVKMMTMLLAMEGLEANSDWSMDTLVQITPIVTKVPRTGVIYLDVREQLPFSDLMKAIAIKSANDAAYQVAEFVGGGDAERFVARMNSRAKELGMTGSNFISPCGLPDRARGNSVSTPADLVRLGEELLQYPIIMEYTSLQQASIPRALVPEGRTDLTATNKLVNPRWPGVDGLKTGYIDDSGYCVTVSCLRGGRRILAVVTGYKTARDRDRFCRQLIDWAYARAAELESAPPAVR